MRTNLARTLLVICSVILTCRTALATGACCSVSPGGKNQPSVAIIGSAAWSHEIIGNTTYDLKQQAVLARGTVPLGESFYASGTIGIPVRTSLGTIQGTSSGRMGLVYGVGAGVVFPEILPPLSFMFTVNYNRSEGKLSSTVDGSNWDARFIISEFQGVLVSEVEVLSEVTLYAGARLYSGKNKIRDNKLESTTHGDREGNASPFLGIRSELWDGFSLVAEGSLGHTRVVSLAASVGI